MGDRLGVVACEREDRGAIVGDDVAALQLKRVEQGMSTDEWVTVLVASDPGARTKEGRNSDIGVGGVGQFLEFDVEIGHRIVENLVEVVDAHFNLIKGLRAYLANGVRAPEQIDDAVERALPVIAFALG